MLICGCTEKENEKEIGIEKERITLTQGSYRSIEDEINSIYSFNDESRYEKVDTEELVISYNNESGNYIFIKDDDVFVNYLGENIKVNDKKIKAPKLSNDGKYLFYNNKWHTC